MKAKGVIRKLSVNDMKNGLTYMVGQAVMGGKGTIIEIRLDPYESAEVAKPIYDIIVEMEGAGVSRIWKTIEGMPVAIEYELEPEKDVESQE